MTRYRLLAFWIYYEKDGKKNVYDVAESEQEAIERCAKYQSKVKKNKRVFKYAALGSDIWDK